MAKINRSDIVKTITQGSGKDFYVFEIVINRFFEEVKRQLQAGNTVNIQGLGRFYVDVKKNGATRKTYYDYDTQSEQPLDGKYYKHLDYRNLKTFVLGKDYQGAYNFPRTQPNNYFSQKLGLPAEIGSKDFGGYARVKMMTSKKMSTETTVLRFKAPREVRRQSGSLVNVPNYN